MKIIINKRKKGKKKAQMNIENNGNENDNSQDNKNEEDTSQWHQIGKLKNKKKNTNMNKNVKNKNEMNDQVNNRNSKENENEKSYWFAYDDKIDAVSICSATINMMKGEPDDALDDSDIELSELSHQINKDTNVDNHINSDSKRKKKGRWTWHNCAYKVWSLINERVHIIDELVICGHSLDDGLASGGEVTIIHVLIPLLTSDSIETAPKLNDDKFYKEMSKITDASRKAELGEMDFVVRDGDGKSYVIWEKYASNQNGWMSSGCNHTISECIDLLKYHSEKEKESKYPKLDQKVYV